MRPADLRAERADRLPVVRVQARQPIEPIVDRRRFRHDPPEGVRRHAEASRHADAFDPRQLRPGARPCRRRPRPASRRPLEDPTRTARSLRYLRGSRAPSHCAGRSDHRRLQPCRTSCGHVLISVPSLRRVGRPLRLVGRYDPGLAASIDQGVFVDVDSMLRRMYSKKKQGVSFGHMKVGGCNVLLRGYNPLLATICAPDAAPVVAASRRSRIRGDRQLSTGWLGFDHPSLGGSGCPRFRRRGCC